MARRFLHYTVPVGTACFVLDHKIKGSDILHTKVRWGVIKRQRIDGAIVFMCPFKGHNHEFTSKNFHAFELNGLNFYQIIGLEMPKTSSSGFRLPCVDDNATTTLVRLQDYHHVNTRSVKTVALKRLTSFGELHTPKLQILDASGRVLQWDVDGCFVALDAVDANIPKSPMGGVVATKIGGQMTYRSSPQAPSRPIAIDAASLYRRAKHDPKFFIGTDFFKKFGRHGVFKGEITGYDHKQRWWRVHYKQDNTNEDFSIRDLRKYVIHRADDPKTTERGVDIDDVDVHLDNQDIQVNVIMEDYNDHYVCQGGDTIATIADAFGLAPRHHRLFQAWLQERDHIHGGETSKIKFVQGQRIPYPNDVMWSDISSRNDELDHARTPFWQEHSSLRQLNAAVYEAARVRHRIHTATAAEVSRINSFEELDNGSLDAFIDAKTGRIRNPKNGADALARSDRERWSKAWDIEKSAIEQHKTFSYGHTMADLRRQGLTMRPVNTRVIYEIKWDPLGNYSKHKCRWIICGHKYAMQKGVHYDAVFAPSPSEATMRILQVLVICYGYIRACWDYSTAFLYADIPDSERIPLEYPKEYQQYDAKMGEKLYMIQERNCYGTPSAGRRWGKHRDSVMMDEFNKADWLCTRSDEDPCLYIITSPRGTKNYCGVHTDDSDGAFGSQEDLDYIKLRTKARFEIKDVDPTVQLGLVREVITKDDYKLLKLSQGDYIDEMHDTFRQFMPRRVPSTPCEPDFFLTLEEAKLASEQEHTKVRERGYMTAVGMLIWVYRRSMPDLAAGIVYATRVMSQPTEKAWSLVMRMISFCKANRDRGIQYRSDAERKLRCYYDASDKPDSGDHRSIFCFMIFFGNAPILWQAKKNTDEGCSSTHNEVMALTQASKAVVHIRKLVEDMNFDPSVTMDATPMLGDNRQALKWSREDYITPGNRYYARDLRYSKRRVEDGTCDTRYIAGEDNLVDIGTKAVKVATFKHLVPHVTGYGGLLPPLPEGYKT